VPLSAELRDRLPILDRHAIGRARGLGGLSGGVDQMHHDVGVLGPAPGGAHHRPVEPAARLEDTWRIHQNDLAFSLDHHAAHREAGCLHLAGDDRDLGADEAVDQGRLAGVGRADHGGESGARFVLTHALASRSNMS
jgi:hypothetical protein